MSNKIIILLCITVVLYLLFAFVTMDMLWVLGDLIWRLFFVVIFLLVVIEIIVEDA